MIQLTQYEIAVTSFKEFPSVRWKSPYKYTSNKDKNSMCKYCYNENTNIIVDSVELEKFRIFYHKRNIFIFTVVHCDLCNAVFSFYKR